VSARNHSEDLGVDGRIILEWILGWQGVDWIHLAKDRDQWRGIEHRDEPSGCIKSREFLD
jgi:hypothetical protein